MIGTNLRLLLHSRRWVPPLLLWLIALSIVVPSVDTSVEDAASLFVVFLIVGIMTAIIFGNTDDDGHRDLLAVAAGSPARLHVSRALAVTMLGAPLVVLTALGLAATDPASIGTTISDRLSAAGATVAYLLSGLLLGVAAGSYLHQPIVRHRGAAFLIGCGVTLAIMLFPPLQSALRRADVDETTIAAVLFASVVVVFGAALAVSSKLAARRSR